MQLLLHFSPLDFSKKPALFISQFFLIFWNDWKIFSEIVLYPHHLKNNSIISLIEKKLQALKYLQNFLT